MKISEEQKMKWYSTNKSFLLLVAIATFWWSCGKVSSEKHTLDYDLESLAWLEGTWEAEENGVLTREVWKMTNKTLVGKGTVWKGDTLRFKEELEIRSEFGILTFFATVPSQNEGKTISFILSEINDTSVTFLNAKHDFPKIINYSFSDESVLNTSVMGIEDGKTITREGKLFKKE